MSRSHERPVQVALLALLLLAIPSALAVAATDDAPSELVGDWYVLIHYRDVASEDPQREHWEDEIWRIVKRSDRLTWTLHPHVTLRDDDGRFETLPSGERARTAIAWSPTASQLEEIRSGLVLDDHESRGKSLRGSSAAGWRSGDALRSPSASMIAYSEAWSISGPRGARELTRRVVFESARTERAEGRTVFTVREALDGGREMTGDYARDGQQVGGFRMIRIDLPREPSR